MAENLESSTTSVDTPPATPAPPPALHLGVGALIIVPSLFVAVMVGQQGSKTTAAPTAAVAPVAEAPGAPTGSEPTPEAGAAIVPESRSVKSELEELSAQLKTIHGLVNGLPTPEPAADLKPIEGKIDEVSRSIKAAMPLLEKVHKLGGRIGDMGKQIESLQTEVVALKERKSGK